MSEDKESCLLVVLRPQVTLVLTSQCPTDYFTLDGTRYDDLGKGDFYGFYDWLRNPATGIVGVRHNIFDEFEFPYESVTHLPYVLVSLETQSMEIYFSDDRGFDEAISDDQEFGSNRVYKSSSGEYALSFRADGVAESLAVKPTVRLSAPAA